MAISPKTRKQLWGKSGNRCARCNRSLIEEPTEHDDASVVGEECHIVAQESGGPRAGQISADALDRIENLILLCGTCHKIVDDQTGTFTTDVLRMMKSEHEAMVYRATGAARSMDAERREGKKRSDKPRVLSRAPRSDVVFSDRIAKAFPGTRGLEEINDPHLAVDRLGLLLQAPLSYRLSRDGTTEQIEPVWWFRGGMSLPVWAFERLGPDRVLLDVDEIKVRRIAAYRRPGVPTREFVYVEAEADVPVGVYQYQPDQIGRELAEADAGGYGSYVLEEYALWQGRPIKLAEHDDGAAIIDGVPTIVRGAEARRRFLTRYNVLICGRRNVINTTTDELQLGKLLDDILIRDTNLDSLVGVVNRLPIPSHFSIPEAS
jgi:hypothetical protein